MSSWYRYTRPWSDTVTRATGRWSTPRATRVRMAFCMLSRTYRGSTTWLSLCVRTIGDPNDPARRSSRAFLSTRSCDTAGGETLRRFWDHEAVTLWVYGWMVNASPSTECTRNAGNDASSSATVRDDVAGPRRVGVGVWKLRGNGNRTNVSRPHRFSRLKGGRVCGNETGSSSEYRQRSSSSRTVSAWRNQRTGVRRAKPWRTQPHPDIDVLEWDDQPRRGTGQRAGPGRSARRCTD